MTQFSLYRDYGVTPGPACWWRAALPGEKPDAVKRFLKAYFRANEQLRADGAVTALVELTKLAPADQLAMVKGADWYGARRTSAVCWIRAASTSTACRSWPR